MNLIGTDAWLLTESVFNYYFSHDTKLYTIQQDSVCNSVKDSFSYTIWTASQEMLQKIVH
jgi:hypothetical protein